MEVITALAVGWIACLPIVVLWMVLETYDSDDSQDDLDDVDGHDPSRAMGTEVASAEDRRIKFTP